MQTERPKFEQLVIGALLQKPELAMDIEISSAMFESSAMEQAFTMIQTMQAHSEVVDLFTVSESLEKDTGSNGWTSLLGGAVSECFSPNNIKAYASKLRNSYQTRQAMVIAERLTQAVKKDGMDAIDSAVQQLMELGFTERNHDMNIRQALTEAVDNIDLIFNTSDTLPGVTTGLGGLDEILGGFHDSDLCIIGARPAMGKTALMINQALAADVPSGIISSEQPGVQIGTRMIAMQSRLNANKLRNADLDDEDWPKITNAVSILAKRQISINDKAGISIAEVVRQARAWKHRHNIKILYLDYIQRIKATNRKVPRHEQIGEVVMSLKELARDLNIPIVALAQVNREVDKRNNKRPGMADLKDSGSIEQEADTIMSLYRDEVYNHETQHPGTAEIEVLKNRHGPTGFIRVVWLAHCMRFENHVSCDKWSGPNAA